MSSPNPPAQPSGSSKRRPDAQIVQPTSAHTHTIIFLHGLGSNGEKWKINITETAVTSTGRRLPALFPSIKFIFPTALKRRSSQFKRATINQWFDLNSLEDPSRRSDLQYEGLTESSRYIRNIINVELETLPKERVVLAGISQGCAMALTILLSLDFPVGGFVGMSGWLPFCKEIEEAVLDEVKENDADGLFQSQGGERTPVVDAVNVIRDVVAVGAIDGAESSPLVALATPAYLGHGEKDEKVRCKHGEQASKTLAALGMDVAWMIYPELEHWFGQEELDDIVAFLRDKVGVKEVSNTVCM